MLSVLSTVAQQSFNSSSKSLSSPIVDENGNVTFSIYAPNAQNVSVFGDFSGSPATLVSDTTGLWSVTLSDVAPEYYIYQFNIDGLKIADPSNPYTKRDISTTWSTLMVPGDVTENYQVKDIPHGSVTHVWYDSPSVDSRRRMAVYTPAGYSDNSEPYPVLYLLHGMGGDEEAWLALGRTQQIMDNLIAQQLVTPMIVVMPNGNIDLEAAPGETSEGFVKPTIQLPHTMEGTYEHSFTDIVSFVDSVYNTIPSKNGRAVAGLSMGGFNSLNISALYPDMFDYVGLFSAAINPRANASDALFADREKLLARQFETAPKLYWIGIGKDDFLYDDNVKFRNLLDSNGYKYVYHESDGGHSWKNWRKYLQLFAPLLFRAGS